MPVVRSGPLAAWATAWLLGRTSLDEVIDAVTGGDAPHAVGDLPGHEPETPTLRDLLVGLRRTGGPIRLVLPVPGDVRGVPGPAAFRAAALEAGEAVVAPSLGAVPGVVEHAVSSARTSVTWRAFAIEAVPRDHLSLVDAQYELTTAVRESASVLAAAGGAGVGRETTAALRHARHAGERPNLPPGSPGAAVALLAQAERLHAMLQLAAVDPGGRVVDSAGIAQRAEALRPLATAVRRARLVAYNAGVD